MKNFYTFQNPGVGNYSYQVEFKDPQTECTNIAFFDAIVHPTPSVTVQMGAVHCSPYAVELTATGNQAGTYTWSNGMSGASIVVDHGGPYRVTFKPDGADCEAMTTFNAPKSPEEYTWIFPTGCFSYCKSGDNPPYIIGPIPYFIGDYRYDINGNPISGGIGVVPDLPLVNNLNGGLTLSLNNGHCSTITDMLQLSEDDCKPCDRVKVEPKKFISVDDGTGFIYYQVIDGGIMNPYNFQLRFI